MPLSEETKGLVSQWLSWDKDPVTRTEIETLAIQGNEDELSQRLSNRIAFGTAGLRARMQAGFNSMNNLIVQQTSQGLCTYLEQVLTADVARDRGLVIGFDGRYNSKAYALITAASFASRGHKVYLMSSTLVATPFVPFGVQTLGAAAGVMVTASHNPKDDNGYKVYWGNGCQIISPHDSGIASEIMKNLQPWANVPDFNTVTNNKYVSDPTSFLSNAYFSLISNNLCNTREQNGKSIKITYTAMHGVGHQWCKEAFRRFGFPPYIETKEQVEPDPNFPTVKFPNPEEGKGALALAISTAEANNCSLILANDPDADRLAVAEKYKGSWKIFNGNEIGILFAGWVWEQFRQKNPTADVSRCAMVSTAVSSKMIKSMAAIEGFQYHEVLTGFKWIGNKAQHLQDQGVNCLFGYEEAIGFMVGNLRCLDKDGIRGAVVFAELANSLYAGGGSVSQYLEALYSKYGYHCIATNYFFCYNPIDMDRIFRRLRSAGDGGSYMMNCGEYKIVGIRDQTNGYDSSEADKTSRLPEDKTTQMITYSFANGCVATLRGSGTEPKLKYYVEVNGYKDTPREQVVALHKSMITALVDNFLQPLKNNLQPPPVS